MIRLGYQSFQTVKEVSAIQNNFYRTISPNSSVSTSQKDFERQIKNEIIHTEIDRIEELMREFKAREDGLLARMGYTNNNYKDFYRDAKIWASRANGIINNTSLLDELYTKIWETAVSTLNYDYLWKQLTKAFINKEGTFDWDFLVKIFGEDKIENEITGLSKEIIKFDDITIVGNIITIKTRQTFKMGHQIKGKYKSKDSTTLATAKVTMFRSSKKRESLEESIQLRFEDVGLNGKYEILNLLDEQLEKTNKELAEKLKPVKADGKVFAPVIANVISKYFKAPSAINSVINKHIASGNIATSTNKMVLKGMLGELYWMAFFESKGIDAQAIGNSKLAKYYDFNTNKYIGSVESPTDIIFETWGFQVKHYKMDNNIIQFRQGYNEEIKPIGKGVKLDRIFAQIDQPRAADIVGKFYFSKNYNLVNSYFSNAQEIYGPVYNRFNNDTPQLVKAYIDSYIDKILKVNRDLVLNQMGEDLIQENIHSNYQGQLDLGKPTMFFINEMPVLASEILQGILFSLRGYGLGASKPMVSINLNSNLILNSYSGEVWPYPDEPNDSTSQNASYDYMKSLDGSYYSYSISLNLSELVNYLNSLT